jgi:hypothetical protein
MMAGAGPIWRAERRSACHLLEGIARPGGKALLNRPSVTLVQSALFLQKYQEAL